MEKRPTSGQGRSRRPSVAFGLIGLPVAGSVFMAPVVEPAAPAIAPVAFSAAAPQQTDDVALQAYVDAGYSSADADVLSQDWGVPDVYQTKVKAGSFLAQGVPLAASPYADPAAADGLSDDQLAQLFLDSGYTIKGATILAENWGVDPGLAKVKAGRELKTVGVLPFVDPGLNADGSPT